jgi:hypothetical protein
MIVRSSANVLPRNSAGIILIRRVCAQAVNGALKKPSKANRREWVESDFVNPCV